MTARTRSSPRLVLAEQPRQLIVRRLTRADPQAGEFFDAVGAVSPEQVSELRPGVGVVPPVAPGAHRIPNRRIGHLKGGYEASFLVLAGDPVRDFMNVKKIDMRIKQGEVLSLSE